ncbi:UNVERIFIED_ORG: hypothetical protein J2Y77_003725 [Pseudomonas lini]
MIKMPGAETMARCASFFYIKEAPVFAGDKGRSLNPGARA